MPNPPAPNTLISSRFGEPRAKRQEEFRKLLKAPNLPTAREVFQGKTHDFPIIRVPINLPKYRLANGRTASSQEEFLAKHPTARKDLFSADPELLDAQEAQHGLLLALANQSQLLDYFKDVANKQVDPIFLDEMGFVINGNRRLSSWRKLLDEEARRYGHFSHVDVVVLPHCDEKDIDRLEAALQIKRDIKADYTWDAQANMMLQKRKRDNFSDKELGELYDMKESEVRDLIDMREYAAEYLRSRGKENHWSLVSKDEFAFKRLVVARNKLSNIGEQELFKQAAYTLIDQSEDVGGRLYEAIPGIQEYLAEVKSKLQSKFQVKPPQSDANLTSLFGGGQSDLSIDIPLAAEIQKPENSQEARKIIIEVIESQKQLKRDTKTATYLLECIARANAQLSAAAREGLRPESTKAGVGEQIKQIETYLAQIKKWLSGNA